MKQYGSLSKIPTEVVGNTRNDMYLASEALRLLVKDKAADLSADDIGKLNAYKNRSTTRPNSSRPGSKSRWHSPSASGR